MGDRHNRKEKLQKLSDAGPRNQGLIANVIRFARVLRSHDIPVPLSCLLAALEGLPHINISRIQDFHILLRCHFVCHKDDLRRFD